MISNSLKMFVFVALGLPFPHVHLSSRSAGGGGISVGRCSDLGGGGNIFLNNKKVISFSC